MKFENIAAKGENCLVHPAHMRRCIFGRAAGFLGSSGIKNPPDCSVGRGRCRSDLEFLAVLGVVFVKAVRVHGHDAVDIFVRVERLGLELDHGDGDVRAVVGHTLAVGEQVVRRAWDHHDPSGGPGRK